MTSNGVFANVEEAASIFRKVLSDPDVSKTLKFYYYPNAGERLDCHLRFESAEEMRAFYKAVAHKL